MMMTVMLTVVGVVAAFSWTGARQHVHKVVEEGVRALKWQHEHKAQFFLFWAKEGWWREGGGKLFRPEAERAG